MHAQRVTRTARNRIPPMIDRSDEEEILLKRWDISIPEDNEISALQQIGLSSPFSKPGRLSHAEPLVHVFNNWVLDRVLGPG